MWFHSLLASWKSGLSRSPRPQPRPARRGPRLTVEHLEDRALPSSYTAASVSDLIADINAANKAGGTNTISLTAPTTSPYALTAVNNTNSDGAANGLPVIAANDNLTILGSGDTIQGTGMPGFRLLQVASGGSLTLQNLTLQGGFLGWGQYRSGSNPPREGGGAIYNQGALTLSGVTVANNWVEGGSTESAAGGGIFSTGSLTLENGTLLKDNVARGGAAISWIIGESGTGGYPAGAAFGGAVYVAGGTANISNTTFTANGALGGSGANGTGGKSYGAAIYVAAGQVVLTTSAVNNNSAINYYSQQPGYGGGLYVAGGTVTLVNDTVESNKAWYGGGLFIANGATVCIDAFTRANVINNTATTDPNIDGTYIET